MKQNNIFEWNVLIALFKATQEQQSMLIGQTKHEAKLIFNRWSKQGDKLLKLIEQMSDEERLEELTKEIENKIHELRLKQ
jgi:hypothetical protein